MKSTFLQMRFHDLIDWGSRGVPSQTEPIFYKTLKVTSTNSTQTTWTNTGSGDSFQFSSESYWQTFCRNHTWKGLVTGLRWQAVRCAALASASAACQGCDGKRKALAYHISNLQDTKQYQKRPSTGTAGFVWDSISAHTEPGLTWTKWLCATQPHHTISRAQ